MCTKDTGFAFAGEEGDLNAMQARYGNLRSSVSGVSGDEARDQAAAREASKQ